MRGRGEGRSPASRSERLKSERNPLKTQMGSPRVTHVTSRHITSHPLLLVGGFPLAIDSTVEPSPASNERGSPLIITIDSSYQVAADSSVLDHLSCGRLFLWHSGLSRSVSCPCPIATKRMLPVYPQYAPASTEPGLRSNIAVTWIR